ncbi:chondroitin sulfate proteoglycan 4-like [Spea bombifrons]|uniref:chondroitin sulfate proteoglycan 4-like n=1 Tax=Spea bombifrons TaxID=233779 RepID=UPI0023494F2E|nr:chondroitin sulfate proteoglycan 4-like [Spea bombifrons]
MGFGVAACVLVLGVVLSSSRLQTRAASFYGESYIEQKIEESFTAFSLQLRFRTSKPNGLLFLAAGKNDYSLVQLHSGRIQVKMNFGGEEHFIVLDQGPRLDDLDWHFIVLNQENTDMTLSVDERFRTNVPITGSYQLDVQHGVYVGGLGQLNVPYTKKVHGYFRGCMDDVIFNGHQLLSSLRPYPGLKSVHEVSLGCSDEFFVSEEDPINLFSSKSYIALPTWNVAEGGIWECLLQASAGRGLLLYQSGTNGYFVSVEVQDWQVKAHTGKGKDIIQLSSVSRIIENKWHSIRLKITDRHMHLTVDDKSAKVLLASPIKALQLNGPLYIGGVDDASRPHVISLGLSAVSGKHAKGGSFKGCVKTIKLNSVKYGLKHVLATKDVSPGCKTEIPPSSLPVLETKTTHFTTTAPTAALSTSSSVVQQNIKDSFIILSKLIVPEGGRAALQSKHIKLNLDFKKLGLRQSQVSFHVVEHPQHGQLKIEVPSQQEKDMFTMLDLWHGRITYLHDGSEETADHFSFSITTTSKNEMPSYLQGSEVHVFSIAITPTNDAPELSLPEGNLFVLLENSKKPLTGNLIKVSDVDTGPQNLNLVLLGNLNVNAGYLENIKKPGEPITTFSYSDLLEGNVFYAHHGLTNSRLALRVVDGDKVSNTVVLRILAVPLEYKVVNNTGVEVIQGESSLILISNLAVETNAGSQDIDIRYDITEMPKYGQIQRRSSGSEWKPTTAFTQRSMDRERVRYLSSYKEVQEADVKEYFKFKVTIANKSSEEFLFPIRVRWLKYKLLKNVPLTVESTKKTTLGPENLFVATEGIKILEEEMYFKLLSMPKKGKILLENKVLKKNARFTQADIEQGKVEYQLIDQPHEDSDDSFSFALFTKHAESKHHNFIIYLKADLNTLILTNKGLLLAEGDAKLLTKDELFVQTMNNKTFKYKVLKSPQHGRLKLINFSNSQLSNDNITAFSSQDILSERLMYVHDDSETTFDTFTVVASSIEPGQVNLDEDTVPVQTEFVFNMSIELKNDEKPVRVVDKLFHVARNSQRLLTLEDLCYHDPDTDFNDQELLYTRRGIPNGDLVSANDTSKKLYQFTQGDMEKKQVLFVHRGSDYGRFVLFVTDGKHYTSSLLEVSASEPFVKIVNNTGVLVQKGKEKTLTTANISIVTNLYLTGDEQIVYDITLPPTHGKIIGKNMDTPFFTHQDLKLGYVVYKHDDSNNLMDTFNVTVKVKDIMLNVEIKVRIYLESHQQPPTLLRLNSLVVEEGRPVKIDKEKLQVIHEDNSPDEILFTVLTRPSYGYIRKFESYEGHLSMEPVSLVTFTQKDVNNGNIQYVQSESGQLQDSFEMEATNGVRSIGGITMHVDIIPILIPLEVQNITVKEGASKALTPEELSIPNKHFAGLLSEFVLIDLPKHGYVENTRFPGTKLSRFNTKQVEQELIYYVHDDSETLLDHFSIIVNNTELSKQSLPQSVYVSVVPVNDEIPVITVNRIFRVWVGSVTEVTPEDLSAEDKDSSPAGLLYSVTPPSNGHLALKSDPNKSILNFTQEHINEGLLVFVHNGAMSGGFNFQVTDGLNFAPRQIFSITARTLVISLEVNQGLAVFPGTQKAITSDVLKVVSNDEGMMRNRTITFNIASPPKHGKILKLISGNAKEEVSGFTQEMVDEGIIIYSHTDSESLIWSTQDSFTFTASSPPAALTPHVFQVTISYDTTDPNRQTHFVANTGALVEEGGRVLIDKSKLDATNLLAKLPESQRPSYEVWYQVIGMPSHGVIIVGDRNITKEKPNFSQYIINKFGITYVHDGSESLNDNFTFATWLNLKSKSAVKPEVGVAEEVFNISIIAVNDQAPELKTKRPSLKVLQGKTVAIGPDNLNVEDLDNPPEDIKYTVISPPNNGFLAKHNILNASIDHFTQADINGGSLWFVQDGSASSGVFYFSVTDGKHKPLYKLFNLEVTPVSITFVNKTNPILPQGQTFVTITNTHLAAVTDGKSTKIIYDVVHAPTFGSLLIDNTPVATFDQADIENGKLIYRIEDLNATQDSFQFDVFTSESNLTGQLLNITVVPLLRVASGLKIPSGTRYILTTRDLDATELGNLTDSDPEFHLLDAPGYGRLVRRTSPQKHIFEDIEMFTQSEVGSGYVLLDVNANVTDVETLNDSFTFLLKADNVPPAVGALLYSVVPYDPVLVQAVTVDDPLFTTTAALLSVSASFEKKTPNYFPNSTYTDAPVKSVQRLGNRNRWGNWKDEDLLSVGIQTTSPSVRVTTVKSVAVSPKSELSQNSSALPIVIPLVVFAVLVLAAIFFVWLVILKRKAKKSEPHVRSHSYSVVPQMPSPYTERSVTVPTVTVTPLLKGPESSSSPVLAARHEHVQTRSDPSLGINAQQKSLLQMDPEMVQLCRTTHPTLKTNQYWV